MTPNPEGHMASYIQRRKFLATLGGAAACPLAARAQQAELMQRIGVLTTFAENDALIQSYQAAFRKRLDEAGWQDGHNIRIDYRWAAGSAERLQLLAKELVESKPDLIFAQTTSATEAVLRLTRTIPTIFVQVTDPVGGGFVTSLNRPGGNVTGFVN